MDVMRDGAAVARQGCGRRRGSAGCDRAAGPALTALSPARLTRSESLDAAISFLRAAAALVFVAAGAVEHGVSPERRIEFNGKTGY